MVPVRNKRNTVRIILLMFAYIVLSGLLYSFSDRISAYLGFSAFLDIAAGRMQNLGVPYPRVLAVLVSAMAISGVFILTAALLSRDGKNSVIEVRLKNPEEVSTFERYLKDLKYYGASLIPGFRSGVRIKSVISAVYFLVSLLPSIEGNFLITAALISIPFVVFGLHGIVAREIRKVDLWIKIAMLACFVLILGSASYSVYNDYMAGSLKSDTAAIVLSNLPGILKDVKIPADEGWFYDTAVKLDRASVLPYLKKSELSGASGDLKSAGASLAIALSLDPSDIRTKYELSKILAKQGETEKALELLLSVQQSSPDFAPALKDAVRLLTESGRYAEAKKAADICISKIPGDPEVYRLKGALLADMGDFSGAAGLYDRAIALDISNAAYHKEKAAVLLEADRLDEASFDIENALKLSPGDFEANYIKGRILLAKNDFEGALDSFGKSVQANSKYLPAEAWMAYTNFRKGGSPFDALQETAKLSAGDNVNAELHYVNALMLSDTGSFDQAMGEIDKAITLNSKQFDYYCLKAEILLKKGATDGTLQLLQTALEFAPEDDYIHFAKGRYFLLSNNPGGALAEFKKAFGYNPYYSEAYAFAAVAASEAGIMDGALDYFYTAEKLDPGSSSYCYAQAGIYFTEKRYQSALGSINAAVAKGGPDAVMVALKQKIESAVNAEKASQTPPAARTATPATGRK